MSLMNNYQSSQKSEWLTKISPSDYDSNLLSTKSNYPSTLVRVGTPSAAATVTHITAGTFPLLAIV